MPFFVPVLFLAGANSIKEHQSFLFTEKKISFNDSVKVITDSNCSLTEALSGRKIPFSIHVFNPERSNVPQGQNVFKLFRSAASEISDRLPAGRPCFGYWKML